MPLKKKKRRRNILILGVGNILLKDEGFGVKAVSAFKERFIPPGNVSCVDGGTAGLTLLPFIKGFTDVIILDAVAGKGRSGTVYRFSGKDALRAAPTLKTSAHELNVNDILALAGLGGRVPEISIIGIKPKEVSPGLELTHLIRRKLPEITDMVRKELERLGVKLLERQKYARDGDGKRDN